MDSSAQVRVYSHISRWIVVHQSRRIGQKMSVDIDAVVSNEFRFGNWQVRTTDRIRQTLEVHCWSLGNDVVTSAVD